METLICLRNVFIANKSKTFPIIIFLILICIFCIVFYGFIKLNDTHSKQSSEQHVIMHLNQIETTLKNLNATILVNSTGHKIAINDAVNKLNAMQSELVQISTDKQSQEIQGLIIKDNQKITDQLQSIQHQLHHLQQTRSKKELSARSLPFQVISVDIWNGEPQATIALYNSVELMAQNDRRSGWKLISISFSPAQVIFKNQHDQYVKINI